jgi:hypothetical protein
MIRWLVQTGHWRIVDEVRDGLSKKGQTGRRKDVIDALRSPVWVASGVRAWRIGIHKSMTAEDLDDRTFRRRIKVSADDCCHRVGSHSWTDLQELNRLAIADMRCRICCSCLPAQMSARDANQTGRRLEGGDHCQMAGRRGPWCFVIKVMGFALDELQSAGAGENRASVRSRLFLRKPTVPAAPGKSILKLRPMARLNFLQTGNIRFQLGHSIDKRRCAPLPRQTAGSIVGNMLLVA